MQNSLKRFHAKGANLELRIKELKIASTPGVVRNYLKLSFYKHANPLDLLNSNFKIRYFKEKDISFSEGFRRRTGGELEGTRRASEHLPNTFRTPSEELPNTFRTRSEEHPKNVRTTSEGGGTNFRRKWGEWSSNYELRIKNYE